MVKVQCLHEARRVQQLIGNRTEESRRRPSLPYGSDYEGWSALSLSILSLSAAPTLRSLVRSVMWASEAQQVIPFLKGSHPLAHTHAEEDGWV